MKLEDFKLGYVYKESGSYFIMLRYERKGILFKSIIDNKEALLTQRRLDENHTVAEEIGNIETHPEYFL